MGVLKDNDIEISMDGRGRVQVNIFIESLWWSRKYQNVYLWSFNDGVELRTGLKSWFCFCNQPRFHRALDGLAPDEVCFKNPPHPFAEAA